MRTLYRIVVALLGLLTLLGQTQCQNRETEIVIISMNDVHAQIDPFDKVVGYIDSMRGVHPNLLVLSAGDLFSGNPMVDYHADKGMPIIDLLNDCKMDASAVGNHEFDYRQEVLKRRMEQASFPFLCANMHTNTTVLPQTQPYKMVALGREQVAIVGLTQGKPDTHIEKLAGLTFDNPIETFGNYVSLKKDRTLLVALTHIGYKEDSVLASRYPTIDLIVGGHSHTILDTGVLINGVLVTQAGGGARYLGVTTLKVRQGALISKRNHLVMIDTLHNSNAQVKQKIEIYNNNPELNAVIGQLKQRIDSRLDLGNFFCDAIRHQTQADIVFQNLMGIRIERWPQGNILVKNVYQADPFGNEAIQVTLTGKQIVQYIEDNFARFKRIDLCVSGINYTINRSTGKANVYTQKGVRIQPSKPYTVAMNSYMALAYPIPGKPAMRGLGIATADAVIQYIKTTKDINYASPAKAVMAPSK